VRFRPGGFAAFWRGSVRDITGRVLSLREAFGAPGVAYENAILGASDDDVVIVQLAEDFLRARRPQEDAALSLMHRAMSLIQSEHRITRVRDLAGALGIGVRTLQRLFTERVGVSPKWAINRARLQDAAARVMAGKAVDWSRLALELGYFDQAHLIRAYRKLIGVPPAEHARRER
jgi:AraC-like DNA-binding protein